jgi:hypothetical protein
LSNELNFRRNGGIGGSSIYHIKLRLTLSDDGFLAGKD